MSLLSVLCIYKMIQIISVPVILCQVAIFVGQILSVTFQGWRLHVLTHRDERNTRRLNYLPISLGSKVACKNNVFVTKVWAWPCMTSWFWDRNYYRWQKRPTMLKTHSKSVDCSFRFPPSCHSANVWEHFPGKCRIWQNGQWPLVSALLTLEKNWLKSFRILADDLPKFLFFVLLSIAQEPR